jgi:hypothetical protein
MPPVLDLDPMLRPASLIGPITPQTFKAHVAGGAEQVRPNLAAFERIDEYGAGVNAKFLNSVSLRSSSRRRALKLSI